LDGKKNMTDKEILEQLEAMTYNGMVTFYGTVRIELSDLKDAIENLITRASMPDIFGDLTPSDKVLVSIIRQWVRVNS
jgi:hypothetical protein